VTAFITGWEWIPRAGYVKEKWTPRVDKAVKLHFDSKPAYARLGSGSSERWLNDLLWTDGSRDVPLSMPMTQMLTE
jgi:hypothetical protein